MPSASIALSTISPGLRSPVVTTAAIAFASSSVIGSSLSLSRRTISEVLYASVMARHCKAEAGFPLSSRAASVTNYIYPYFVMEHGETPAAARLWLSCERLPPRFLPDWRTKLINPGAICGVPRGLPGKDQRPDCHGRFAKVLTPLSNSFFEMHEGRASRSLRGRSSVFPNPSYDLS